MLFKSYAKYLFSNIHSARFAVKYRQSLINESWETELYKYINGVIQNKGQLPIAINGMPDHIHILFIMKPTCCISDLVREIKKSSTEFITVKRFVRTKFQWQHGFGAFSYSQSSLDNVKRYKSKTTSRG